MFLNGFGQTDNVENGFQKYWSSTAGKTEMLRKSWLRDSKDLDLLCTFWNSLLGVNILEEMEKLFTHCCWKSRTKYCHRGTLLTTMLNQLEWRGWRRVLDQKYTCGNEYIRQHYVESRNRALSVRYIFCLPQNIILPSTPSQYFPYHAELRDVVENWKRDRRPLFSSCRWWKATSKHLVHLSH